MITKPEVQDKLRQEITDFLAKKPNYGYNDVDGLRYLHNFCREVFRRHNASMSQSLPHIPQPADKILQ